MIHPKIKELLENIAQNKVQPLSNFEPKEAKKLSEQRIENLKKNAGFDPETVFEITDQNINHIPIRIYKPSAQKNLPIVVYAHGGGLMTGSIEGSDLNCRHIANRAKVIFISVAYRLSPEHKFPCAANDFYEILCWASQNAENIGGNSEKISVFGDSSGGNLAAVATLMAKDKGFPKLYSQILVYPQTDGTCESDSYKTFATGYNLTTETMKWYISHYQNSEEDLKKPYFSPIFAQDLSNLPPTLVFTAELDPLRDDGFLYAEKLKKFGVPTEYICYQGVIHGFFQMPKWLEPCREMIAKIIDFLQK